MSETDYRLSRFAGGVSPLGCLCLAAVGTQARNVPLSAIVQRVQAVVPVMDSVRLTMRVLSALDGLRDADLVQVLPCNRPPPCFTIAVPAWAFFRDLTIAFPDTPAPRRPPFAFQGQEYFDNLVGLPAALAAWRYQFWRLMFRHADYFMKLPDSVRDSEEWSRFKTAYTAWRERLDADLASPPDVSSDEKVF